MRFRLPERCRFCSAMGSVRPEHTIRAGTVTAKWCCSQCDRDWPFTEDDQQADRRSSVTERRKHSRSDRRNRRRPT